MAGHTYLSDCVPSTSYRCTIYSWTHVLMRYYYHTVLRFPCCTRYTNSAPYTRPTFNRARTYKQAQDSLCAKGRDCEARKSEARTNKHIPTSTRKRDEALLFCSAFNTMDQSRYGQIALDLPCLDTTMASWVTVSMAMFCNSYAVHDGNT